jgi:hypothetical protein
VLAQPAEVAPRNFRPLPPSPLHLRDGRGPEGKGGIAQRREITTKALSDYGIKRVEELAKAPNVSQKPQYFKGRDAEDYVLANVVTSRHPMAMHRLGPRLRFPESN